MLFIVLFIAVCRAADTTEAVNKQICGNQYYNIEKGACDDLPGSCAINQTDPFYGCYECAESNGIKQYSFKGTCIECNCLNNAEHCFDEFGCTLCPNKHILEAEKISDGSYHYICTEISSYETDVDKQTEKDLLMISTEQNCKSWDGKGCSKCDGKTVWNDGLCVPNEGCHGVEPDDEDSKNVYKCANCTSTETGGTKNYYMNKKGICVECDTHCLKCDPENGNCETCEDGYITDQSHTVHKRCYKCDPNCASGSCVYDANKKHHMKCSKCRPGYFNVNNERCIRCPAGCAKEGNCADNRGCINCDEPKVDFLIPDMYLSEDGKTSGFHFNLSGIHIGWCVPHQAECPLVNRTINGCLGCDKGYVLDTVTYKFNGSEFKTGFCSGASSLLVVFLIALLLLAL